MPCILFDSVPIKGRLLTPLLFRKNRLSLRKCPPVRPVCPATKFGPPKTCSSDGSCPGVEKCCFDRCLETTVCKTPIYPGGGGIGGLIGGGGLGGPIGGGGLGDPFGGSGFDGPIGSGGLGGPIGGGLEGPIGHGNQVQHRPGLGGLHAGGGLGGQVQHGAGPGADIAEFARKGPKT